MEADGNAQDSTVGSGMAGIKPPCSPLLKEHSLGGSPEALGVLQLMDTLTVTVLGDPEPLQASQLLLPHPRDSTVLSSLDQENGAYRKAAEKPNGCWWLSC